MRACFSFLLAFCLPASLVLANVVGNDTQNFNPITSGLDFVTVQGTVTLDPGLSNVGFFVNSARNVLPDTVDANGNPVSSNDVLSFADVNFGYGLLRNVDIGLNLSYLVAQQTDREEPGAQFGKTGLNEIRANTKIKMLERKPVGLAMILSANLNQVRNNPFLGKSPGPTTNVELAADGEFSGNVLAGNIGYRFRNPGTPIEDSVYSPLGPEFIASIGFSHYFSSIDMKFISEIFGAQPISPSKEQPSGFASEFLLGGKFDSGRYFSWHAGLSRKLTDGLFAPDLRAYLGLNITWEIGPQQAARSEPEKITVKKDIYKGFQPQDIVGLEKTSFDKIQQEHEFALRQNLPENIEALEKPPFEVFRLEGFDFAFGSSEVQKQYYPLLNRLVKYLNAYPPVLKARIEGHTDSVGTEERNRDRSETRAKAVMTYLKTHGLRPDIQLEAIGYGSSKPIADNSNYQGRQKNRRVEVRILREIKEPEKTSYQEEIPVKD